MTGTALPGWDLCLGVARALNVRPEVVFRKAGLLPRLPRQVAEEDELVHIYRELPAATRTTILTMLRGLAIAAGLPAASGPPGAAVDTDMERQVDDTLLQDLEATQTRVQRAERALDALPAAADLRATLRQLARDFPGLLATAENAEIAAKLQAANIHIVCENGEIQQIEVG